MSAPKRRSSDKLPQFKLQSAATCEICVFSHLKIPSREPTPCKTAACNSRRCEDLRDLQTNCRNSTCLNTMSRPALRGNAIVWLSSVTVCRRERGYSTQPSQQGGEKSHALVGHKAGGKRVRCPALKFSYFGSC